MSRDPWRANMSSESLRVNANIPVTSTTALFKLNATLWKCSIDEIRSSDLKMAQVHESQPNVDNIAHHLRGLANEALLIPIAGSASFAFFNSRRFLRSYHLFLQHTESVPTCSCLSLFSCVVDHRDSAIYWQCRPWSAYVNFTSC